ncbi:hypothetical protein FHR49_002252 [Xanthomonas campestris]
MRPCCPNLGFEAWSADQPRAVGRVCHNVPFELGSASCPAYRMRASARAGS